MRFFRNLILLTLLVGGALYFTNPGPEAFSTFLAEHVQTELADEVPGETEIGKAFRKGLGQIAGAAGGQLAQREDFQVASIYTLDIAGDTHRFLGVAGQFIPIEKVELQPD